MKLFWRESFIKKHKQSFMVSCFCIVIFITQIPFKRVIQEGTWAHVSYKPPIPDIDLLTCHKEAESGDRLQGLVVVVGPALDQRALQCLMFHQMFHHVNTDLVPPADVCHLQIIDSLAVHLK